MKANLEPDEAESSDGRTHRTWRMLRVTSRSRTPFAPVALAKLTAALRLFAALNIRSLVDRGSTSHLPSNVGQLALMVNFNGLARLAAAQHASVSDHSGHSPSFASIRGPPPINEHKVRIPSVVCFECRQLRAHPKHRSACVGGCRSSAPFFPALALTIVGGWYSFTHPGQYQNPSTLTLNRLQRPLWFDRFPLGYFPSLMRFNILRGRITSATRCEK